MLHPSVIESSNRIVRAFSDLNNVVVGRKEILRQLMMALITRNHLLMEGPPGVAKSFLASSFFKCIEGGNKFKVQCTKKMTEDYLIGPLDMHLFREEGEYVHRVEGYLPTAHYAFLDEFLDLSPGALRALLEVLNERTFSRGPQALRCPLSTAIAATNFSGENEEALEAVHDRFLFKAKISKLTNAKDRLAMFNESKPLRTFTHTDVLRVQEAVKRVVVPRAVLTTYVDMCGCLDITDRTVRRCIEVVKASAILKGRHIATLEDLTALSTCFIFSGDSKSEQKFSTAMQKYKDALASRDNDKKLFVVRARVAELRTMAAKCTTYEEITPVAIEAREAINAMHALKSPSNQDAVASAINGCEAVLNAADTLYNKV